jgi:hypothetical protein
VRSVKSILGDEQDDEEVRKVVGHAMKLANNKINVLERQISKLEARN